MQKLKTRNQPHPLKGKTSSSPDKTVELADSLEALLKTLNGYTRKLVNGTPNENAAKGILRIIPELESRFEEKFLNELETSFRSNREHECWKSCFYTPIEALKKQACNAGPYSEMYRAYLLQFVEQAITFYEGLLKKFEDKFNIEFDVLKWPITNSLLEELDEGIIFKNDPRLFDSIVLRSAQRHFIYLGDLYRYKTQNQLNEDSKNYSISRKYYMEAYMLEPLNGHPLNQLAVLSSYEKNWIDIIFYYVRSLSVRLPFDSARESLEMAFNSLRGPATAFETWILEKIDENKRRKGTEKMNKEITNGPYTDIYQHRRVSNKGMKNYVEKWIHPIVDNKNDMNKTAKNFEGRISMIDGLFKGEHAKNMQKKAISHLLHCAGILISGIGIEQFGRVSELALDELTGFVLSTDAILSPAKIMKIIFFFTFPVHSLKTGASQTKLEEQKRAAFGMLIAILERFLNIIVQDLDKIGLYILAGKLSKKFLRVIPSVCFLLSWFMRNLNIRDFRGANTRFSIWNDLAALCNKLIQLRNQGELSSFGEENRENIGIILPELYQLSPYFDVFPKNSDPVFLSNNHTTGKSMCWSTVQARFALILHIGEQLAAMDDFSNLKMKDLDTDHPIFEAVSQIDVPENDQIKSRKSHSNNSDAENFRGNVLPATEAQSPDEYKLKEKLLNHEESKIAHRWVINVHPKYLVPDTNTFIDHLEQIKLLSNSKFFTLLIPTIVIEELNSLSMGVPITGSTILSRELLNPEGSQSAFVMKQAKSAMEWLRDASNRSVPNLKTVTSNGNILQKLSFAVESAEKGKKRSNDDRILSVCINICNYLIKIGNIRTLASSSEETTLERTIVLLTEDRGLSAKAIAEKIPVRTIPNFTQWALQKNQDGVDDRA